MSGFSGPLLSTSPLIVTGDVELEDGDELWLNTANTRGFRYETDVVRCVGRLRINQGDLSIELGNGSFATPTGAQLSVVHTFGDEVTDPAVEAIAVQSTYTPTVASTKAAGAGDFTQVIGGTDHTGPAYGLAGALAKTGVSTHDGSNQWAAVAAWPTYAITAGTVASLSGFRVVGAPNSGGGTITDLYGVNVEELTAGGNTVATAYGIKVTMPSAGTTDIGVLVAANAASSGDLWLQGKTSSGFVIIKPDDSTATWQLTLPPDDGDAGEQLQTNGSGVTTWEAAVSSRYVKNLLGVLPPATAMARIVAAPIYEFQYKPEAKGVGGDYDTVFSGVMADEAPWAMMHGGRIFSPINAFGHAAAAIQELARRLDRLEE